MSIDAKTVKDLRDRTGAGMMDCKKALAETDGDLERATSLLREKGLAGAAKKAGRIAADGLIGIFAAADGKSAVLVELNCETDFVAKTDKFRDLLNTLGAALVTAPAGEGGADAVAGLRVAGGGTVEELLKESIANIGENIGLRRYVRYVCSDGIVGHYLHAGGKIGVLVELSGADARHAELAKALAMQAAAAFPRWVSRSEVPASELGGEREIFRQQAIASGKPEKIVDKIVDGKIEKFYAETCLLEQEYVRDSDLTINKLLAQAGKETASNLSVPRFARYQLGEGIEKKQSNLAAEVAQQIGQSA
ncbi:MAG: elongation factor Ts [Deltaproteobacteria bacterium]|nr:elongation factor Ts [Deltaproteobacteria bacterium]